MRFLRMVFLGAGNRKIHMSFPYCVDSPSVSDVQAIGTSIIANADVFSDEPLSLLSAEVVQTTKTTITLP